jgi:hypothetical protein
MQSANTASIRVAEWISEPLTGTAELVGKEKRDIQEGKIGHSRFQAESSRCRWAE